MRTVKKHTLSIGDMVTGTVKSRELPCGCDLEDEKNVAASMHSHILDDVPVGTSPTAKLKVGKKVTARVIGGRDMKTFKYGNLGQGWLFFLGLFCLCRGSGFEESLL